MSGIPEKNRKELIELARETIRAKLLNKNPSCLLSGDDLYSQNRGCFVTLHKNGNLRGCIGIIEPVWPLAEAVKMNAINAAFDDPRFFPVQPDELEEISVEISVLSVPEKLDYSGADDLIAKLIPEKHGVIISRGSRKATFLPQVWQQLPDPVQFLKHLCSKAGLNVFSWREPDFQVQVYEAEVFAEE